MAKEKLPNAKDYENRTIDTWTTTTFLEYMKMLHMKYYGIPYQCFRGGIIAEKRLLKLSQEEMGNETLREVIDIAFDEYKPNGRYPNLAYGFVHTYMKPNIYSRIMAKRIREERIEERKEKTTTSTPIDESWI